VVNISGAMEHSPFPRVNVDYADAGHMAAEHLRKKGFKRFAYYGLKDLWYSHEVHRGYVEELKGSGFEVESHLTPSSILEDPPNDEDLLKLDQWLKDLPKPIAILAAHDPRGSILLQRLQLLQIDVPADVAVMSVNNDSQTCEFSKPTMTSIQRNEEKVGFLAAKVLDQCMRGQTPTMYTVIPPLEVIERQSTRTLALENPLLQKAIQFMQEQVREDLSVDQIAQVIGKSRRWLEMSMKEELQVSPKQVFSKIKTEGILDELRKDPGIKIHTLANNFGIRNTQVLNRMLVNQTGQGAAVWKRNLKDKSSHHFT
jgi:LacI family transcriptional regulator